MLRLVKMYLNSIILTESYVLTGEKCLVAHFGEDKTCKGTDIQIVASLYMSMHRKMSLSGDCLSKRD